MNNYFIHLKIDGSSPVPKYQQLAAALETGLKNGQLAPHELLPSINRLSIQLDLARNTVEKSYRKLRDMGLISAVKGSRYTIL